MKLKRELGPLGLIVKEAGKLMYGDLWRDAMTVTMRMDRTNFRRLLYAQQVRPELLDGTRLKCAEALRNHASKLLDAAGILLKELPDNG